MYIWGERKAGRGWDGDEVEEERRESRKEMARGEGGVSYFYNNNGIINGRSKLCSYKRTTMVLCSINIGVAIYVLHSLCTSLYFYSYEVPELRYTPDQIRKMEESIRIRKESEPVELIKLVAKVKKEFFREKRRVELPEPVKHMITDEILERLRDLNASGNATIQREAIERWRKTKLKYAKKVKRGKILNSTLLPREAGMLSRALESDWAQLSEDIGLWIPVEIVNKAVYDKPEGEEDDEAEILPGKKLPPECHGELHTDYNGAAVRWGLSHHKDSAYECCQACLDQAKNAKPEEKKCNIWVYCPSETGCYSPDIYEHKLGECWLKYAEKPKLNFKDRYSESYRSGHPNVPLIVPWVSGVVGA